MNMNIKLSNSEKIDVIYELSNLLPKDVLVSILLDFNENIDDLINILSDRVLTREGIRLLQKWFTHLSPRMKKISPTPVLIITLQSCTGYQALHCNSSSPLSDSDKYTSRLG